MSSQKIRSEFLNYFKNRGHSVIASAPVVPHDDPTLLFNNSGMSQFKDVFLGKSVRDYKRATTAQKCIRVGGKHNDLDNVGHTSRHLTFFEMLGNFSFGDYFKEEAIQNAWEVSCDIFGFEKERIWVTVFETDDEAASLWEKFVPKSRIIRLGEKDNFWAMGETGPCGPCSELLYDRGEKFGSASSPKEDLTGERYLEFWNLVFMQYNKDASGKLSPLPKKCIDTGAGLERVISLQMGVSDVFATDILRSLIAQIETISGKKYDPKDEVLAPAFHVIADHIRSLSFAIADGVQPSNLDRGYVLRKLLRRAVRYGRMLGLYEPFLSKVLPRLIELMGNDYRELKSAESRIAEILTIEEESFLRTLKRGGNILQSVIEKAAKTPLKQISGEEAFTLKDTYGFPIEEVLLLAKDHHLSVNLETYQLLEEQAKEKSRGAHVSHKQEAESDTLYQDFLKKHGPCEFTGYTSMQEESSILAIIQKGKFVDSLETGEEGMILLKQTPFYAEKGGQVGDIGTISHKKASFSVSNTTSPFPGVIAHIGKVSSGTLIVPEPVVAQIDVERRKMIANHHTATHLLHYALQKVLGEHIRQAGSLVESSRLRFDFTHHKPLLPSEIRQIEDLVNEKIRENKSVKTLEISYEEAQKKPEIKQFFGDKYGSVVRVVDIDYSQELCGGTHVEHLGGIGLFRILKESSIAAGVRRIEAAVGKGAEEYMYKNEEILHSVSSLLKTPPAKIIEMLQSLEEEKKTLKQECKHFKEELLRKETDSLLTHATPCKDFSYLTMTFAEDKTQEDLLFLADDILKKKEPLALLFSTVSAGKCQLLIKVSPSLVKKGVAANALMKEIAPLVGGGGGGKPESAQAGGKNPENIEKAFAKFRELLQTQC